MKLKNNERWDILMNNKIFKLFFKEVFSSLSFDKLRTQENNYSVTNSELEQEIDQMESTIQPF